MFHVCVHTLSCLSAWLFATLWTAALQAPLSMEFSRQGYWNEEPFPSPGNLPDTGTEPTSLAIACTGRQVLYHSATCISNLEWKSFKLTFSASWHFLIRHHAKFRNHKGKLLLCIHRHLPISHLKPVSSIEWWNL